MDHVSVLGLGAMGYALAETLMRTGRRVTVWNRTAAKANPLVEQGAALANDPATAISAADVIIVCVDNYEVTSNILAQPGGETALAGKTLVQLSTGTPQDARDAEAFAQRVNADYLDGAIMDYPDQIGSAEATIFVAGAVDVFERTQPVLQALAGGTMHVGETIGSASALDCAGLSVVIGTYLGTVHGARICETEDIPVDLFGQLMVGLLPVMEQALTDLTNRIATDNHEDTHAALQTYSHAAQRILMQAENRSIDPSFPDYATELLGRGEAAGLGGKDLSALIKLLRGNLA